VQEFQAAFGHEIERQLKENPNWFDFHGFDFPYTIDPKMLHAKADGKRMTITQELFFGECYFHGGASFESTTFQAPALFSYATFEGAAVFKDAAFRQDADFNNAKSPLGWFEDARFHGIAEFSFATFDEGAFERAKFMAKARFVGTTFQVSHFEQTKFQCEALFSGAIFQGDAWFKDAVFKERMWFLGADFQGLTVFSGVTSEKLAWFEGAKFGRMTDFIDTVFLGYARFNGAEFRGETLFGGVTFSKDLDICPVPIHARKGPESVVKLVKTKFDGHADFDWSGFIGASVSTLLVLRECGFGENGSMTMSGAAGCFSLLHSDLSKTEFLDEDWRERIDLLGSMKPKRRRAVLDEYILDRMALDEKIPASLSYVNTDSVAQLYRRLRHNYEASRRYAEAGEFFVGEMEVLRKYKTVQTVSPSAKPEAAERSKGDYARFSESWKPPNLRVQRRLDWYRLLLLEPYKWLALYGERIGRPVFWAILVVVVFTVVRPPLPAMLSSAISSPTALTATSITQQWDATIGALMKSAFAFFQLRGQDNYDLAERLCSAPILGLLFIAIRRKLERQ
jgi:uncharacterized protein YjbI with pentapeptide repeats